MSSEVIQQLADRVAITELMARYAERIDAADAAGAAACFAPDGIGDYWGECHGREAITARLTEILARFNATQHHLSNTIIELDGTSRARARSYVYAFHRMAPDNSEMHVWGRWHDDLVKVDGQWLFAYRRVVLTGSKNRPGGDLGHARVG